MSIVASSSANILTTKPPVEQPKQHDLRSKISDVYHDRKSRSIENKRTSAANDSSHFDDKKVSEHVLRFYKDSDDEDKDSESSEEEEDGHGQGSFHQHSATTDSSSTAKVLPSSAFFTTAQTSFSNSTAGRATLSAANSSAGGGEESTVLNAEDSPLVASEHDSKSSSSQQGDGITGAALTSSLISGGVVATQGMNAAGMSHGLSEPLAATVRLNQFLDELTAAAAKVRFNTDAGNDVTINLRSDVLDGTSVRIVANPTHVAVSFSTSNAESSAMLNSNLATLQNHLNAICPGQLVSVKTDFLTSASSSRFGNENEQSGDDSGGDGEKSQKNS